MVNAVVYHYFSPGQSSLRGHCDAVDVIDVEVHFGMFTVCFCLTQEMLMLGRRPTTTL